MSVREPDFDSDSDEDLTEAAEIYARRLQLRLQLRKWESRFLKTEGRPAVYEDKKIDRTYQTLRSQLRQTELSWLSVKQEGHSLKLIESMSSRAGAAAVAAVGE